MIKSLEKVKNMDYPEIDIDLCTGCGICVNTCPMDAIELKDDIAVINNDECSNCRACESECPAGAIH